MWSHHLMGNRWGNSGWLIFLDSKITADGDCNHEIKRHLLFERKVMINLDRILKSRDITLPNKGPSSQCYVFSISHIWMWQLDYKESWALKNWCFCTVMLEKMLESPLNCKEIQPVHSKGDQSWVFTGRTDVEAETPILWPPDVKHWLIGKDPNAGRVKMGGEGDDKGWDGWMASLTQWTWDWVNSRSRCWIGWPGMRQSTGSPRVRHDWVTKHTAHMQYQSSLLLGWFT